MSWFNREYGLGRETDQKFKETISSGWLDIEQKTENQQKKIIITHNRKRLAAIFLIALFFLVFIFFISGYNYFLFIVIFCLAILPQIGFLSKKMCIIENISDNSIIIRKQSIFKSEITVYKKEENPALKLIFKDSQTNQFGLAITSNNKMTILSFIDPPFPFYYSHYYRTQYSVYEGRRYGYILRFSEMEVRNISNFLDMPTSGKINSIKK